MVPPPKTPSGNLANALKVLGELTPNTQRTLMAQFGGKVASPTDSPEEEGAGMPNPSPDGTPSPPSPEPSPEPAPRRKQPRQSGSSSNSRRGGKATGLIAKPKNIRRACNILDNPDHEDHLEHSEFLQLRRVVGDWCHKMAPKYGQSNWTDIPAPDRHTLIRKVSDECPVVKKFARCWPVKMIAQEILNRAKRARVYGS